MQEMEENNIGCMIGKFGFVSISEAQNSQYSYKYWSYWAEKLAKYSQSIGLTERVLEKRVEKYNFSIIQENQS